MSNLQRAARSLADLAKADGGWNRAYFYDAMRFAPGFEDAAAELFASEMEARGYTRDGWFTDANGYATDRRAYTPMKDLEGKENK